MNRKPMIAALLAVAVGSITPLILTAQGAPVPVPVTGRRLSVELTNGDELRGELIEALDGSLLLMDGVGLHRVSLDDVSEIKSKRHDLDAGRVAAWVAIGALVTGVGMTIAAGQVDDTNCAGVLPAMALTWTVVGLPLGFGIANSAWERVPTQDARLRSHARFPQGAPAGFLARREGNGPSR